MKRQKSVSACYLDRFEEKLNDFLLEGWVIVPDTLIIIRGDDAHYVCYCFVVIEK